MRLLGGEAVSAPLRLPFVLADFTRTMWASGGAQAVWEPAVQRYGGVWEQIERLSVLAGIRAAALQSVSPGDLAALSAWAASQGLAAIPLAQEGAADGYSATPVPVAPGGPWRYRVAIARAGDAAAVAAAWGDDERLGRLLGYPACCREFFRRVWVEAGRVDTTWEMAETAGTEGPAEANILLRWLGVRLVPHLPCSFSCAATAELGRQLAALGRASGFAEDVGRALEMLAWPVEWNALHGIAEVRTPVCKVSTRTDATADRLIVQRPGSAYPAEGVAGLAFPYRVGPHGPLPKALPPRIVRPIPPPARSWQQNGFASREAQDAAHAVVAAAALRVRAGGQVLDLGCGNGALAQRIAQAAGDVTALGVEQDPVRAASARRRLGGAAVELGPISGAWPGTPPYALVLLMPGRLTEATPEEAAALRSRLEREAEAVLLYAYDDWLERFGGLGGLAAAAGLSDWRIALGRAGPGIEAAVALPTGPLLPRLPDATATPGAIAPPATSASSRSAMP
jgi:Methyltransferase small domain